jgi:hypothetical protein
VNILESKGYIDRKPFKFQCEGYKVWFNGQVIQRGNEMFRVIGEISGNKTLAVYIRSEIFSKYVTNEFYFHEISLNKDRILWSNNLMSVSEVTDKMPSAFSLFYKNRILSRVAITIDNPQILIELDGISTEFAKEESFFVNPVSKGKLIDLDHIERLEFVSETVEVNHIEWGECCYKIAINCMPEQPDMVMVPNYSASKVNMPDIICKDKDFWIDIACFFSYYHETHDLFTGLYNSLIGVFAEHISKYKRLVDTDIFTLSSEFIIFVNAIYKGRVYRDLQENEKNILFNNCLDYAIKRFGDYIYKTHYRSTINGVEAYFEKI